MKGMGSLWRASSAMSVEAPPLSRSGSFDLIVIGGGFTGNSAALEAARRGAKVALLEAETFGFGGSGRNVGLVNAGLWLPPDEVRRIMGDTAGHRLLSALAEGPSRVWEVIAREGIDCEATKNGTLHLADSKAGMAELRERFRQGRNLNWPVQLIDAGESARRTGNGSFYGGLLDPRAGTIQPLSYARGLAQAAIRAGATLHEGTRVTRARHEGGQWLVTANGHELRARFLFLATNAYFDGIDLGFQPEIIGVHYFQLATAPMGDTLRETILPGGEGCWDTAMVMTSFRIDQAGRMIIGSLGNSDSFGRRVHLGWARRKLASLFPQLRHLPFEYDWQGRIAMTNDHIPKIVAFGPEAFASFGYSGRGISPGTVFGAQSAIALLEGNPDALPVAPVPSHRERFVGLQEAYYETGATLAHLSDRCTGK